MSMSCRLAETHDGVQDMACDTFIKIAQKCRRHFVTVQIGETFPFIDEILQNLRSIICDLSQQQVRGALCLSALACFAAEEGQRVLYCSLSSM